MSANNLSYNKNFSNTNGLKTTKLSVDDNVIIFGNVSVGKTTAPGYTLDVNGNMNVSGSINSSGGLTINTKSITGNIWYGASSGTNSMRLAFQNDSNLVVYNNGVFKASINQAGVISCNQLSCGALSYTSLSTPLLPMFMSGGSTQTMLNGVFTAITQPNIVNSCNVGSCYSTTTGLFTPNVAGYYVINGSIGLTTGVAVRLGLYKNGTVYRYFNYCAGYVSGSCIVYFNGTTDNVQLWCVMVGSNGTLDGYNALNSFDGYYLRSG